MARPGKRPRRVHCDFSLVVEGSSSITGEVVLAVGEDKQPTVVLLRRGQDIIGSTDLVQRWQQADTVVRKVLRQIFTYMVLADVGYGVLTVVQHTWIIRRLPDKPLTLEVS